MLKPTANGMYNVLQP